MNKRDARKFAWAEAAAACRYVAASGDFTYYNDEEVEWGNASGSKNAAKIAAELLKIADGLDRRAGDLPECDEFSASS